ncbi:MAG: putative 7-cyano-7-deazaguanine synthase [Prokaryotic dsDNA virus sp.]|nr:MAG: putative 7-cyano-7-deazaguanine synthase [Prokaryotic dsDNA virus sp.]|tara:strand:+ start:322 stop:906 length:585 start_codon:yes stop_codon:yes gene_type:complete
MRVVLLSGGMDSALMLHHVVDTTDQETVIALSFDYGQAHCERELKAASLIAERAQVFHGTLNLKGAIASPRKPGEVVPARNLALISAAANWAHLAGGGSIYVGMCKEDDAGFPDCRPEFISAVNRTLSICELDVKVCAPWVHKTKKQAIALMRSNPKAMESLKDSYSCYRGVEPCGSCGACLHRDRAFKEAGLC